MSFRSHSILAITVAALMVAAPAAAQSLHSTPGTTSIEAFISRYHLDVGDDQRPLDAAGGRVLWRLSSLLGADDASLAARTRVGAFLAIAAHVGNDVRATHYGAQADLHALRTPLWGRVDPIVSLGLGAFRAEPTSRSRPLVSVPIASIGDPMPTIYTVLLPEERPERSLAVSPAIGARVLLAPGFSLRGDVRDLVRFRSGVDHSLELSAGLSVSF